VLSCVGRDLHIGLITRPEESYRVYKIRKPQKRKPRFDMGCSAVEEEGGGEEAEEEGEE
jgi:hypothetical protein